MIGKIHSIESLGTFDGPGIRTVVFFQGCPLRCIYCHNPDTRDFQGGTEISSENLLKKFISYKTYYESSNGGVTFSGGEPLAQSEFLLDLLKKCKAEKIHTTIDTSGIGTGDQTVYEEILSTADLVLLDIKHYEKNEFYQITKTNMDLSDTFKKALLNVQPSIWIRHVVVPGITDSYEHLCKLKEYLVLSGLKKIEKVELLPYHTMGVYKYKEMGLEYPLEGIQPMDKEQLLKIQGKIFNNA